MCDRNLLPLALGGAGHETRDVHELDGRGQDLFRLDDVRERLQAQVRHRHDADVRVDRAEWVVGRRGVLRLRHRVEQCGLADVRQPDDSAFDSQEPSPGLWPTAPDMQERY
jgi:hypothetical protein